MSNNETISRKNDSIRAVEHVVKIMECFSIKTPELGVSEISEKTGLYKSTVYRILATLLKLNWVVQNEENKKYTLGFKMFEMGCAVVNSLDLRKAALPIMEQLGEKTRETISLSIVDKGERVCIEKVESKETVRDFVRVGTRSVMYCGAVGKVLLAFSDEKEQESILQSELISPATGGIISPDILKKELEIVRYQGYAVSREERQLGVASVAAPIRDYTGKVIAALSVSGPIHRFPLERVVSFVDAVSAAAAAVSGALGYSYRQKAEK